MNFDWDPVIPRLIHDARALLRRSTTKAQLIDRRWSDAPPEFRAMLGDTIAAQASLDLFFRRLGVFCEALNTAPGDFLPVGTAVKLGVLARRDRAASLGATIEIGEFVDVSIFGNLQAVVQELLDNAMTFTVPDRPIRITIRSETDGQNVTLTVSDNGSGWDPNFEGKLFLPFERLDARGGFGFGLAIAKALVERAGGGIQAVTNPTGSTFTITVPSGS